MNTLVGSDPRKILDAVDEMAEIDESMFKNEGLFGDGNASTKIIQALIDMYNN